MSFPVTPNSRNSAEQASYTTQLKIIYSLTFFFCLFFRRFTFSQWRTSTSSKTSTYSTVSGRTKRNRPNCPHPTTDSTPKKSSKTCCSCSCSSHQTLCCAWSWGNRECPRHLRSSALFLKGFLTKPLNPGNLCVRPSVNQCICPPDFAGKLTPRDPIISCDTKILLRDVTVLRDAMKSLDVRSHDDSYFCCWGSY